MDVLTISGLRDLISVEDGRCVSIYMPTYPRGREGQQDSVRLKNLVTAAEQQLVEQGMRGVEAHDLLRPILDLQKDAAWTRRKQSLAIFRSEARLVPYWLAILLEEAAIVDRRFHIKRLLPAISTPCQFYVLAVSRNQVRLLRATCRSCERLHVPGLPMSIKEALNLQGADRGEQVHSGGMQGDKGKEAGVFHGQGGHRDTLKDEVVEYFRVINESLRPMLLERPWPLILAGTDYELAMFRNICDYNQLSDEMLYGNFDHVQDHALYQQALPLANTFTKRIEVSRLRSIERWQTHTWLRTTSTRSSPRPTKDESIRS